MEIEIKEYITTMNNNKKRYSDLEFQLNAARDEALKAGDVEKYKIKITQM